LGSITVPSSLDRPLTALLAATIENVDRVGPCGARVTLEKIEDVRERRREEIIRRAQEILRRWTIEEAPTPEDVAAKVAEAIIPQEVIAYGPDRLAAGPEVEKSPSIIIVEGRADVANLLRAGVKNAIACEGANISDTVVKLSQNKEVTVLLDGDRGGDIILEALLRIAKVDYVARAPRGREVEELSPRQILKILSEKVPVSKFKEEKAAQTVEKAAPPEKAAVQVPEAVAQYVSELRGTLEAVILNEKLEPITKMPVSELAAKLQTLERGHTIVFDGVITQRLVDIALEKGVKRIIGDRISGVVKRPVEVQLFTAEELGIRGP
jgi:DNA primase